MTIKAFALVLLLLLLDNGAEATTRKKKKKSTSVDTTAKEQPPPAGSLDETVDRWIDQYDADWDGSLSAPEVSTFMKDEQEKHRERAEASGQANVGPKNEEEDEDMFEEMDKNGDGRVTRNELIRFFGDQKPKRKATRTGRPKSVAYPVKGAKRSKKRSRKRRAGKEEL